MPTKATRLTALPFNDKIPTILLTYVSEDRKPSHTMPAMKRTLPDGSADHAVYEAGEDGWDARIQNVPELRASGQMPESPGFVANTGFFGVPLIFARRNSFEVPPPESSRFERRFLRVAKSRLRHPTPRRLWAFHIRRSSWHPERSSRHQNRAMPSGPSLHRGPFRSTGRRSWCPSSDEPRFQRRHPPRVDRKNQMASSCSRWIGSREKPDGHLSPRSTRHRVRACHARGQFGRSWPFARTTSWPSRERTPHRYVA